MKKTLGKYLIFLLFFNFLYAEDYFFKTKVDKNQAYQREAILLQVDFYKREDLTNITFDFTPQDRRFNFKKIEKRVEFKDGYEIEKYKYLAFAKSKGWFKIRLKPTIKIDKSSDGLGLLKKQKTIDLEPIQLEILQVQRDIDFVGEFELNVSIDKRVVLKNEPVHLNLNFKQSATPKEIELKYNIKDIDIYEGDIDSEKISDITKKLNQKISFVSDKNFTIPSLSFKYFNVKTKRVEEAKTSEFNITIYEDKRIFEKLLDEEPKPKDIKYYQAEVIKYSPYFIVFIVGFILGRLLNIKLPKFRKKRKTLFDEIKATKEKRELIKLLLPYANDRKILEYMNKLEDENLKFKKIKKEIIKDKSLRLNFLSILG